MVKKLSTKISKMQKRHVFGAGIFVLPFAVLGVILLLSSLAAGSRMYLTPATLTAQTGTDITVEVRVEPETPINSVDATLTYDQTVLQYKSTSVASSAFTTNFFNSGGNGTVNVASGLLGTTTAIDSEIAKVTFTVIGTAAGTTTIRTSGLAADNGVALPLQFEDATVTIQGTTPPPPPPTPTATSFTIEPTVAAPIAGSPYGLRVYANSTATYQGGEVTVNLPTGTTYSGTLDTSGTAFNPATTVNGTTAQIVKLVFVTQSTTMTGKQLIATIPVTSANAGSLSVTMTEAKLVGTNDADITPITANPFTATVNLASLPAPTLTRPGKTQITATEDITDLKQSFTITNFDSAATYAVSFAGQTVAVSGNSFSIPASVRNGNHTLLVSVSKSGASGNASYTIRLRSPNVNRTACVELRDLLAVNKSYGQASNEYDLNFDGNVGLIDLLTVTGSWGAACI